MKSGLRCQREYPFWPYRDFPRSLYLSTFFARARSRARARDRASPMPRRRNEIRLALPRELISNTLEITRPPKKIPPLKIVEENSKRNGTIRQHYANESGTSGNELRVKSKRGDAWGSTIYVIKVHFIQIYTFHQDIRKLPITYNDS